MKAPLGFAIGVVRTWTHLHTWLAPIAYREARHAEIESDLWEFERDTTGQSSLRQAGHVLTRLLAGVPDDLAWRAEHLAAGSSSPRRAVTLAATVTAFFLIAIWTLPLLVRAELPQLPAAPIRVANRLPPPPPPPPPIPRPRELSAGMPSPPPPPPPRPQPSR